jgi:hypothetical protein
MPSAAKAGFNLWDSIGTAEEVAEKVPINVWKTRGGRSA